MANVSLKFKGLESVVSERIVTNKFRKKLAERVIKDIKQAISIGKSPVKGQGRYKGYTVDRAKQRTGSKANLYPNSVKDKFPNKQKRPVNLKLSGALLKAIKWKAIKCGVKIGLISANKKLQNIFESHNEGTNEKRNVPRRALLPTGEGEKFTAGIQKRIRSLFLARIRQVLKQVNKK